MEEFCWKKDHIELINFHVISVTTCSEFNYGNDSEVYIEYMKYHWENQAILPLEAFCFQHYLAEKQNHKEHHKDSSMRLTGIHSQRIQVIAQKIWLNKNFLYQNKNKSGAFFHWIFLNFYLAGIRNCISCLEYCSAVSKH